MNLPAVYYSAELDAYEKALENIESVTQHGVSINPYTWASKMQSRAAEVLSQHTSVEVGSEIHRAAKN